MRFIIDAQLPPALSAFLNSQGHVSVHVVEIGLRDAPDSAIWDYALNKQAVIITKDEDFAIRMELENSGPTIVWIRKGNCTNPELIVWFSLLLPQILRALEDGQFLVEVV